MVLADGRFVTASADGAPRPVLGDARRRRQLRRRHLVPVPAAPGRHRLRRPDALAARAGGRGAALVPRLHPPARRDELNGFFAFLTVPPAPPFPEELHLQKVCGVVWCYTGPTRARPRRFAPIRAQFGPPLLDWRRADAAPGAAEHVRRALPAGRPVVLAGRLRQRAPATRRSTMHVAVRRAAADRRSRPCTSTRSTARRTRRQGRHRLELPRRELGDGDRRRRAPTRPTTRSMIALDARLLGGAAPVLGRRRLREHDDGRGRRSGSARPTATTTTGWPQIKATVRPGQPVPRQPEHRAHPGLIGRANGNFRRRPAAGRACRNRSPARRSPETSSVPAPARATGQPPGLAGPP